MPQMPIYELQTLGPTGTLLADNVPASGIGAAVAGVGQAVGQGARALMQLEDQKGRIEAAALEADLSTKLATGLEQSLQSAQGDPTGLSERHVEGLRQLRDQTLEGLTDKPYARKYAELAFMRMEERETQASMRAEAQAKAAYTKNLVADYQNSIVKNVSADPLAFDEKVAEGAELIDSLILPDAAKVELKAGLAARSAEAAIVTTIGRNPREAQKILADLDDSRTKALTSDDYQRLKHAADMEIERQRERARIEADKRNASAERMLSMYEQRISEGVPVSGAALAEVQRAVRGTPLQAQFDALMADEAEVQAVLRKPATEQQAYLRDKQAGLQQAGADLTGRNTRLVRTLTNAINANAQLAANAPLELYSQQTGQVFRPLETQTFLTDPAATASILTERVSALTAMSKDRGGVAPKPLFDEEAANLRATLDSMAPQARARYLGQMRTALGEQMFVGSMTQVYAGDNNAISAGVFAGRGLKTTGGADVSGLILRGAEILKDKSVTVYNNDGGKFEDKFDAAVGSAVVPGSPERQALADRTKAIYASYAEREGKLGGAIDDDLMRWSVNVASGGIYEHNDAKVVKPYGISDDDFEQRISGGLGMAASLSGYPQDYLEDLPLAPAGREGTYFLVDGGRPIADKTGAPIIIDARQAAPVAAPRSPGRPPSRNAAVSFPGL